MGLKSPFDQLTGTLKVYIAPVRTVPPDVNVTPSGLWVRLGVTDGGQKIKHSGSLTFFTDDDHTGKTAAVRPEEMPIVSMTVVGLTLETYAKAMGQLTLITTDTSPNTKTLPLKRGYVPDEYALLMRGDALSPYGALPGQYYIPRGVFDGEPEPSFTKDERAGLEVEFSVMEDTEQLDENLALGWITVQTS